MFAALWLWVVFISFGVCLMYRLCISVAVLVVCADGYIGIQVIALIDG